MLFLDVDFLLYHNFFFDDDLFLEPFFDFNFNNLFDDLMFNNDVLDDNMLLLVGHEDAEDAAHLIALRSRGRARARRYVGGRG